MLSLNVNSKTTIIFIWGRISPAVYLLTLTSQDTVNPQLQLAFGQINLSYNILYKITVKDKMHKQGEQKSNSDRLLARKRYTHLLCTSEHILKLCWP